jgi:hypothetical protein
MSALPTYPSWPSHTDKKSFQQEYPNITVLIFFTVNPNVQTDSTEGKQFDNQLTLPPPVTGLDLGWVNLHQRVWLDHRCCLWTGNPKRRDPAPTSGQESHRLYSFFIWHCPGYIVCQFGIAYPTIETIHSQLARPNLPVVQWQCRHSHDSFWVLRWQCGHLKGFPQVPLPSKKGSNRFLSV